LIAATIVNGRAPARCLSKAEGVFAGYQSVAPSLIGALVNFAQFPKFY
jgi:hypothetical protein